MAIVNWLIYAAIIILCLQLILQYFIAPIVIYFTNYQLAHPRFMPFEVDMGNYYLDSTSQKYRPTLKGAFIQTWKLVWPVAGIRKFI